MSPEFLNMLVDFQVCVEQEEKLEELLEKRKDRADAEAVDQEDASLTDNE